ncbi:MAG: hypothetical protein K6G45_05910 [Lachnospiraceae bacterium]|nr:hypothetical protein [Lachnospiraceae bacterium]
MKRKLFIKAAIFTAAIMVMTSCSGSNSGGTHTTTLMEAANAKLDSAIASKMDLSRTSVYDASIVPAFEELGFDIDGYIYGIYVSPGTEVEEGEVLASLVSKEYDELKSLKSEIKELKSSNEERFKKLDAEIELAKLAGEYTAERELEVKHEKEQAELKLQIKQERLEQLESEDIGFRYILAPADTTAIAALNARKGTFVRAGSSVVALETEGDVTITCAFIGENVIKGLYDYYALVDGQRVEIEYIPYTKKELKDLSTNGISPTSKFRIKGETNVSLKPGDYVTIITISDFKEGVIAIPSNAVYSDSNGQFVYVVENDQRIRKNVVTGVSDSTYTEIIEGLQEGEMVYVKN